MKDFGFERTLEDFVFLTFLVNDYLIDPRYMSKTDCLVQLGNDFLPAIPSIDIYDRYGGLDRLINSYKQVREKRPGFLTKNGRADAWMLHEVLKLVANDEHDAYHRIQVYTVNPSPFFQTYSFAEISMVFKGSLATRRETIDSVDRIYALRT